MQEKGRFELKMFPFPNQDCQVLNNGKPFDSLLTLIHTFIYTNITGAMYNRYIIIDIELFFTTTHSYKL